MQLLRDTPDIDRHTRYSDMKKKLSSDPRYKAVDSSSAREDWFREHVKQLKDERKKDKDRDRKDKDKDKDKERKEKREDKKEEPPKREEEKPKSEEIAPPETGDKSEVCYWFKKVFYDLPPAFFVVCSQVG